MLDELFQQGIAAIDSGDVVALEGLIAAHPTLVCERREQPADGFFARPYLLWFVAEDPVRNSTLPSNIADVARAIVSAVQQTCPDRLQEQVDYALRLVAWSWIARQTGVQIALIDVLVDAGATPGETPLDALVNSNFEAAAHLVSRGGTLTLAAALCLERWEDADRLAAAATDRQKQLALTLAALKGKVEAVRKLLAIGVDVNAVSQDLYSHATPLHHAVSAASLETVKVLVAAGARLDTKDTAYDGTPRDWAEYLTGKPEYAEIAKYLKSVSRR